MIFKLCLPIIFSFAFSIGLVIWWKKKTGIALWPFIAGGICFFVFVMVLESSLHSLVMTDDSPVMTSSVLYVLYGTLSAGLFEETARLFGFKVLLKKYDFKDKSCAVAYGIGHGGMEIILVLAVTYIVYLLAELGAVIGDAESTDTIIKTAEAIPLSVTWIAMFERISAMMTHLGLSEIMFIACKDKGKMYLYPVAILLHAFVDTAAVVYQKGIIKSVAVVEIIVFIISSAILAVGTKMLFAKTAKKHRVRRKK